MMRPAFLLVLRRLEAAYVLSIGTIACLGLVTARFGGARAAAAAAVEDRPGPILWGGGDLLGAIIAFGEDANLGGIDAEKYCHCIISCKFVLIIQFFFKKFSFPLLCNLTKFTRGKNV